MSPVAVVMKHEPWCSISIRSQIAYIDVDTVDSSKDALKNRWQRPRVSAAQVAPQHVASPKYVSVNPTEAVRLKQGPRYPPSIGSEQHAAGECRPCAWFWREEGCIRGPECAYCHLCPEGALEAHSKARQRQRRSLKRQQARASQAAWVEVDQMSENA